MPIRITCSLQPLAIAKPNQLIIRIAYFMFKTLTWLPSRFVVKLWLRFSALRYPDLLPAPLDVGERQAHRPLQPRLPRRPAYQLPRSQPTHPPVPTPDNELYPSP